MNGKTVPPAMALALIAVVFSSGATALIPQQKAEVLPLTVSQTLVPKGDFAVTTDPAYQGKPSIAFGNNRFFVVWHDERSEYTNRDIYAKIYSANGDVIKPEFAITTDPHSQQFPSIAFGDNVFFIVWHDDRNAGAIYQFDIYAAIYSPNGDVIKSEFALTEDEYAQLQPCVAFGDGKFFVIWQNDNLQALNCDIHAAIYDSSGDMIKPEFAVVENTGDQFDPWVAFGDNKFFVGWDSKGEYSAWDIYGKIYNSDGTIFKQDFIVTETPRNQVQPSIAFGDNRFFVIWDHNYGWEDEWHIYGAMFNTEGEVVKPEFAITDQVCEYGTPPAITYGDKKFFISWSDARNGGWDVYAKILSPDGGVVKPEFGVATGPSFQAYPRVAYGKYFFTVWEDDRNGNNDIYANIFYNSKPIQIPIPMIA
jgi:hypothetical protein